jgi:membrane-associated phospholipid phosphatase
MIRRVSAPLLGTGACALAFLVLLALAYGSGTARRLDATALQGFVGLQRPLFIRIGDLGDAVPIAVAGALLAAIALVRSRPRTALAVLFLVGATSISSQVLKAVLAYPRFTANLAEVQPAPETFPSGHATATMTIAFAAILVAPRHLRPLVAFVGWAFALAVSFSVVALGWHFPSDVVGGFLLATGWTLIAVAALQAAADRWPERTGRTRAAAAVREGVDQVAAIGLTAVALAAVILAGLASVVVLATRSSDVVSYAQDHTAFVAVAVAIAASAVAVLGGVTVVLRRRG